MINNLREKQLVSEEIPTANFSRANLFRRMREVCNAKPYKRNDFIYIAREKGGEDLLEQRNMDLSDKKITPKVLLFKNIYQNADGDLFSVINAASFYLASSLKKQGVEVVFSNVKVSPTSILEVEQVEELEEIFDKHPDISIVGISLCEGFFEYVRNLISFLKKKSNAYIMVGGVMPTLTPEHVFMHLSEVDILVRGAGEEILPRLAHILKQGRNKQGLVQEQIKQLVELEGVIFHNKSLFLAASINKINQLGNYDEAVLDYSLLTIRDIHEGLHLFTARGCLNNCFFCTTPGRGNYYAKSSNNVNQLLKQYQSYLKDIFNNDVPFLARRVSFYDDDFLADPKRAKDIFNYFKQNQLLINFFQTGINSFYLREKQKYTDDLNQDLLKEISPDLFVEGKKRHVYIGTENFSDRELERLGKGYRYDKIKNVIKALSKKKIYQLHHFIVSNHYTNLSELIENLFKIAVFQTLHQDYFKVLAPVIPYLVSLFPSLSYKNILRSGKQNYLFSREKLSLPGYPEYDYPLVEYDIPENEVARKLVPFIEYIFKSQSDYTKILDSVLLYLLLLKEKNKKWGQEIGKVISVYEKYPDLILKETGVKAVPERNNIQLMVTRRCQLRCLYCPVKKNNKDMSEDVMYRAVDLIFTSSQNDLRIDFTGGEPLLRFDLIKKAVIYAKKLAVKTKKNISFYMVTNLILLNDEIATFLAKEDFSLELSLDGDEQFHNCYKKGKDPKINPYRLTIKQLKKVFKYKIKHAAVCVAGIDTVKYLYQNITHLIKLGIREIGINYALGSSWDEQSQREFFRQLSLVYKSYFLPIREGQLRLNNLFSRSEPAMLNTEIMVDCDGRIFLLTDALFENRVKKTITAISQLDKLTKLSDIFVTRFIVLKRLLDQHRTLKLRSVIFNNIEMGQRVGKLFQKWKGELKK